MNNRIALCAHIIIMLIASASGLNAHAASDDAQKIRELINNTYDSPEHKVVIDPIVVKGEFAIASWAQHKKGGRALLNRSKQGAWNIMLCAGTAVKETHFLVQAGIMQKDAEYLVGHLTAAEAKMSQQKTGLFDSFGGVMLNSPHEPHHQ